MEQSAGFIVKLKKQLPLLWNIVWQNLKALVQGAAERDCRLDMIVNKKLHVILKSRLLLLCQFFYVSNLEEKVKLVENLPNRGR